MVHYAYPSSPMAKELRKEREGCYYVSEERSPGILTQTGPFSSIQDAERFADTLPSPFHHSYPRFPLNGSRFAEGR